MKFKIATLILTIMLPALALAQTSDVTALQQADEYFRNGQYAEAGEIYLDLYGESGDEQYEKRLEACKKCQALLKKAAEAELWGDTGKALENYEEVLSLNATDPTVKGKIDALKQKLGQQPQTLPANPPRPVAPVPTASGGSRPTARPAAGSINGHQYVDLGLPSGLKWATCNMGASAPSEHGEFYAWGETAVKPRYEYTKAKMNGTSLKNISGQRQYDAARAKWGGTWRLPTGEEIKELIECCTWTTEKSGGKTALKGTAPNGNVIILPATGYWEDGDYNHSSDSGFFWSGTNWNYSDTAGALTFNLDGKPIYLNFDFYFGMPVRPVSE